MLAHEAYLKAFDKVYHDINSPYWGLKPRAKYITIKERKKRIRKNKIKRNSRRKNR